MLTHPNGHLMIMESLNGLDISQITRLIITVVKQHIDENHINLNKIADDIQQLKGIRPEFYILNSFTSSQSETVLQTIVGMNVEGPIFVKDCDNYFHVEVDLQNAVCVSYLRDNINAVNKSYVALDKLGHVSGIVEKTVIGDRFCVGGYGFRDAKVFKDTVDKLGNLTKINTKEIYLSHVIQEMILSGETFKIQDVTEYEDWGTIEDWQRYASQFKTVFVDLDGVLVKNGSEYFQPTWGDSAGLEKNVAIINKLFDSGKAMIIITTSRKETFREVTLKQLETIGLKYHKILFEMLHAQRILINDYSGSNPYPSAVAINLVRDADNLEDYHSNLSGRHNS